MKKSNVLTVSLDGEKHAIHATKSGVYTYKMLIPEINEDQYKLLLKAIMAETPTIGAIEPKDTDIASVRNDKRKQLDNLRHLERAWFVKDITNDKQSEEIIKKIQDDRNISLKLYGLTEYCLIIVKDEERLRKLKPEERKKREN